MSFHFTFGDYSFSFSSHKAGGIGFYGYSVQWENFLASGGYPYITICLGHFYFAVSDF